MSDQAKPSVPWDQPGQESQSNSGDGAEGDSGLIQVSCPDCGQALALGREFLGGHCLCSTCDGLMLVSAQGTEGGQRTIVAEMVDKVTGNKLADATPTFAPDKVGAVIDEDTKPVKPWPNEFKTGSVTVKDGDSTEEGGSTANLLQVPCPDCGQVLALGREILGSHCLCSVCDGLMLISLKNVDGEGMTVVAEKVDKITGEIVADAPSTSAPQPGENGPDEDWEHTRPVKMWAGSPDSDDDMDMGLTMPVPKMDTGEGEQTSDDDMDMGLTMPVPKMDTGEGGQQEDDDMDLGHTMPIPGSTQNTGMNGVDDIGATMPIPFKADPSSENNEAGSDWNSMAVGQQPQKKQPSPPIAAKTPAAGGGLPWDKISSEKQGVKLTPPGRNTGSISGKAPSPTSGAVPTMTTPPTKAPPPTTGSVPTLDAGQVAARAELG